MDATIGTAGKNSPASPYASTINSLGIPSTLERWIRSPMLISTLAELPSQREHWEQKRDATPVNGEAHPWYLPPGPHESLLPDLAIKRRRCNRTQQSKVNVMRLIGVVRVVLHPVLAYAVPTKSRFGCAAQSRMRRSQSFHELASFRRERMRGPNDSTPPPQTFLRCS